MFMLTDIGFTIVFALLFISSYFAYEALFKSKLFSNLKINKLAFEFISGTFYGLISLAFLVLINHWDDEYFIPIYALVPILLIATKGINTSLASIFPMVIYMLVKNEINTSIYYWSGTIFVVMIIYLFVDFYKEYWSRLSIHISVLLASLIAFAPGIHDYSYGIKMYQVSISVFISWIIIYFPLRTAMRFSASANLLLESINYVYSKFLRHSLLDAYLAEFIKTKKCKKAIFGVIEIRFDRLKDENKNREITNTILLKVEEEFGKDSLLFAIDETRFGFFTPIDKVKMDIKDVVMNINSYIDKSNPISRVTSLITGINRTYETTFGDKVEVSAKSGISIYGVQDNSINDLERNCLFALNRISFDDKYKINVFNPNDYRKFYYENVELSHLDRYLKLDDYKLRDIPVLNTNNLKVVSKMSTFTSEKIGLEENPIYILRDTKWIYTLDRYISALTLKNDDVTNRMIFYSLFEKQNYDGLKQLKRNLRRINIDRELVSWLVSYREVKKNKTFKQIEEIQNDGFKIYWYDFNDETIVNSKAIRNILIKQKESHVIDHVKPDNIILYSKNLSNDLPWAKKNKIKYIVSKQLELENNSAKLTKQSKILLTEEKGNNG